jgi:hypothetical protein
LKNIVGVPRTEHPVGQVPDLPSAACAEKTPKLTTD